VSARQARVLYFVSQITIKVASINITRSSPRDVIKRIKYSRAIIKPYKECEPMMMETPGLESFIIYNCAAEPYCYDCFINGLGRVVNVYLIRLLLHIDYDGKRRWEGGRLASSLSFSPSPLPCLLSGLIH
jgi:hypothetical protein